MEKLFCVARCSHVNPTIPCEIQVKIFISRESASLTESETYSRLRKYELLGKQGQI